MKTKPYVDNFTLEKLIRDDAYLNPEERLFLFVLKSYRQVHTLECCPKTSWLTVSVGKSERTLQRIRSELEERKYLISVRRGFSNPNNFYFTSDFQAALIAYHCPNFHGDRGAILRANRKRWVTKNAGNGGTGSDTAMAELSIKNDTIKRTRILYGTNYICPHCLKGVDGMWQGDPEDGG